MISPQPASGTTIIGGGKGARGKGPPPRHRFSLTFSMGPWGQTVQVSNGLGMIGVLLERSRARGKRQGAERPQPVEAPIPSLFVRHPHVRARDVLVDDDDLRGLVALLEAHCDERRLLRSLPHAPRVDEVLRPLAF